jgi:serine protease inhibitor ecotin
MSRIRLAVGAALLAAAFAVSAQAQAPAPAPAPAAAPAPAPADTPSTMDKVKTWSQKKWNASKAEMSKDKAKWDGCVAAAHDQKLKMSSKAGWAYVYDCMKKS